MDQQPILTCSFSSDLERPAELSICMAELGLTSHSPPCGLDSWSNLPPVVPTSFALCLSLCDSEKESPLIPAL